MILKIGNFIEISLVILLIVEREQWKIEKHNIKNPLFNMDYGFYDE